MAYKNFIPEIWTKYMGINLDKVGVMMKVVNRDYQTDVSKGGDSYNIQTFGNMTIKTYDGSVEYEKPEEATTQLVMDQKKYWGLEIPDVDKVQGNVNLMKGYTARAKVAIGLTKDTFLLSKHSDVPAGNTLGTTGSPIALTKDNIHQYLIELATIQKNNNAIEGRDGSGIWCVVNPEVEALIEQSPAILQNPTLGKDAITEGAGAFRKIAGMMMYSCTNLVAISSKYYIMAGIKDAITYGSQIEDTEALRSELKICDLVRGFYVYGAKVVTPDALSKIIATIA